MKHPDVALADDPLDGSASVRDFFGDSYDRVRAFALLLALHGVERGLIGPREVPRLWERHILNSAAVAQFAPRGSIVDVGAGAGLPGVVLAAMDPTRAVTLVEPMDRRATWLREAIDMLSLPHAEVVRARAEEVAGSVSGFVVTARAVAPVEKLARWCSPLLDDGGHMVFLKGKSATDEVDAARYALRKLGLVGTVRPAPTIEGVAPTTVVILARE